MIYHFLQPLPTHQSQDGKQLILSLRHLFLAFDRHDQQYNELKYHEHHTYEYHIFHSIRKELNKCNALGLKFDGKKYRRHQLPVHQVVIS